MEKKKIFITGAGSGIGKEAAICLARRGHTVYASIYYQEQLEQLEEISKKEKINLYPFMLDILNEKDREKILNYDIDVYISNAAIGNSGSVAEVSVDKIRQVYETNIFSNIIFSLFKFSNVSFVSSCSLDKLESTISAAIDGIKDERANNIAIDIEIIF